MNIEFRSLESEIVNKNRVLVNLKSNYHINTNNISTVEKELDKLLYRYYKLYRNNIAGLLEHGKHKI